MQQDQIVAPQTVVVHPAAVDLEGGGVVMLFLVEECGALQQVPVGTTGQAGYACDCDSLRSVPLETF